MIFALSFVVIFVIACLLEWWAEGDGEAVFTTFCFMIIVFVAIPISRYNVDMQVERFNARKTTIEQQRSMPEVTEYERATLTQSILNDNAWLAKKQEAAKRRAFNWYYTKEILELEPIK